MIQEAFRTAFVRTAFGILALVATAGPAAAISPDHDAGQAKSRMVANGFLLPNGPVARLLVEQARRIEEALKSGPVRYWALPDIAPMAYVEDRRDPYSDLFVFGRGTAAPAAPSRTTVPIPTAAPAPPAAAKVETTERRPARTVARTAKKQEKAKTRRTRQASPRREKARSATAGRAKSAAGRRIDSAAPEAVKPQVNLLERVFGAPIPLHLPSKK